MQAAHHNNQTALAMWLTGMTSMKNVNVEASTLWHILLRLVWKSLL